MKLLSTLAPTLALAISTLFGATAAGAAGAVVLALSRRSRLRIAS